MPKQRTPKSTNQRAKKSAPSRRSKTAFTSKAGRSSYKNVTQQIYDLNGHLNKARGLAAQIANDNQVFPKTRDNAKFLMKLLSELHKSFWGPLTWYK